MIRAKTIMNANPPVLQAADTMQQAAKKLVAKNAKIGLIFNRGGFMGIITEEMIFSEVIINRKVGAHTPVGNLARRDFSSIDAKTPHRKGLQGEPEEQVRGDGARHPCRHHHGIRARGRAPEFHPLPLHHAGHHPGALRRHDDFLPVLLQPLGGTAVRLNGCGVFRLFRFVEESRIALFCIGAPRAQSTIVCRAIVSRNSQPIFRT